MPRVLLLAALVAAAAANDCPMCDRITNQSLCLSGRHPTLPGPHNVGCGGHPEKNPDGSEVPYCAWNATVGNPGCTNCTLSPCNSTHNSVFLALSRIERHCCQFQTPIFFFLRITPHLLFSVARVSTCALILPPRGWDYKMPCPRWVGVPF